MPPPPFHLFPAGTDLAAIARRMSSIKHKVLVLSGKGGVGKSTFSAQLAFALAAAGKEVRLPRGAWLREGSTWGMGAVCVSSRCGHGGALQHEQRVQCQAFTINLQVGGQGQGPAAPSGT